MTWLDFITDALIEIGAYAPGDTIPASVLDVCQRRLNRRIDEWTALERYAWTNNFTSYTLTPNHSPHLLGPGLVSPDFATVNDAARPAKLLGADLILNTSNPATDLPLNIRDDDWWLNQRVKNLTSTVPTDIYYSPDFPNGALYLWPIPTFAYGLRVEAGVYVLQVSDLSTTFSAPPAYELGLLLTLAEDLTTPLGRPMPATLPARAERARAAIQTNNITSPRIASADYGGGLRSRGGFNWRSGMPE